MDKLPFEILAVAMSYRDATDWFPPGVRCARPSSVTDITAPVMGDEGLACLGEAFLGAYLVSEGGLLSCWLFLEWLQSPLSGSATRQSQQYSPALGHLLFGGCRRPYRGRTPSHNEFQEVFGDDSSCPTREYRRASLQRKCPQERVGGEGSQRAPPHVEL